MPSRILREGILSSDRVNELTLPAEVFYRRLMSVVDDYGRFDARPSMLRVSCYPLRVDAVHENDLSRWIAECVKSGLLALYAVDGKAYLEMQDFRQQARAKSKYPPATAGQPLDICGADEEQMLDACLANAAQPLTPVHLFRISESESESESGQSKSPDRPPAAELPSDFSIQLIDGTEYVVPARKLREWGQSFPAVDVEQQLRAMRSWCDANPKKRKTRRGIESFVVRWLQKEQDNPSRSSSKILPNGSADDWTSTAI